MIKTIIGALLAATITTTNAATLLYSNGFDGSFGDVTKMYECANNAMHAFSLVTSPKKSGIGSIKIESFGELSDMCPEWGGAPAKHRVQLQLGLNKSYPGYPSGLNLMPNDRGPWWVGFSVYIPSNIPTGIFILFDIKAAHSHFGEPTAFFHQNKLDVRRVGAVMGGDDRIVFPRDRWVDVVWMLERSKADDGRMRFWMNGKLTKDEQGATIPADNPDVQSWFRIGIYYTDERPDHKYVVYFDNVKIARGVDGFNLVNPSTPGVPPEVPKIKIGN